tara:strand:- start:1013 stop:1258 length:246 start_codon:yes stop_codon:yes gene_type:complete
MIGDEKLIDNTEKKNELRLIIDKHVAEYLARGGKITKIEAGETRQGFNLREVAFEVRNERVRLIKERQNRELMLKRLSEKK